MRNVITAFAIVAAIGSAFALYAITYDTGRLSGTVGQLSDNVAADEAEIAVLRAEKANLTRPARIDRLVKANLKLHPIQPGQLGQIADLPWRGEASGPAKDVPPVALQP
jgi:cell division protein FtsL